jgi:hypothetical protein
VATYFSINYFTTHHTSPSADTLPPRLAFHATTPIASPYSSPHFATMPRPLSHLHPSVATPSALLPNPIHHPLGEAVVRERQEKKEEEEKQPIPIFQGFWRPRF